MMCVLELPFLCANGPCRILGCESVSPLYGGTCKREWCFLQVWACFGDAFDGSLMLVCIFDADMRVK